MYLCFCLLLSSHLAPERSVETNIWNTSILDLLWIKILTCYLYLSPCPTAQSIGLCTPSDHRCKHLSLSNVSSALSVLMLSQHNREQQCRYQNTGSCLAWRLTDWVEYTITRQCYMKPSDRESLFVSPRSYKKYKIFVECWHLQFMFLIHMILTCRHFSLYGTSGHFYLWILHHNWGMHKVLSYHEQIFCVCWDCLFWRMSCYNLHICGTFLDHELP